MDQDSVGALEMDGFQEDGVLGVGIEDLILLEHCDGNSE